MNSNVSIFSFCLTLLRPLIRKLTTLYYGPCIEVGSRVKLDVDGELLPLWWEPGEKEDTYTDETRKGEPFLCTSLKRVKFLSGIRVGDKLNEEI